MNGICTLGNDRVLDQILALLNSIEACMGPEVPVCIYPYNDNVTKLREAIAGRPQVSLYDDRRSIEYWDQYVRRIWDAHPKAKAQWRAAGSLDYYRVGTHRRFCAFDGPFEQFIYMDADTLLLQDISFIWDQLEHADWITYDFQHKNPTHVYAVDSPILHQVFSEQQIAQDIFCSGFYGTHRRVFSPETLATLLQHLESGEAELLYPMAPDQTILNYMVMRSGLRYTNLALSGTDPTGNCVTSSHFEVRNDRVYDGDRPLTYLHYIGVASGAFQRLCQGENLAIPYRGVFLHYRYRHEPNRLPRYRGRPQPVNPSPSLPQRLLQKLGLTSA